MRFVQRINASNSDSCAVASYHTDISFVANVEIGRNVFPAFAETTMCLSSGADDVHIVQIASDNVVWIWVGFIAGDSTSRVFQLSLSLRLKLGAIRNSTVAHVHPRRAATHTACVEPIAEILSLKLFLLQSVGCRHCGNHRHNADDDAQRG